MNVIFVHQNFPGQYRHLARYLAAQPANQVVFITQRPDGDIPGVRKIVYRPSRGITPQIHYYLVETEAAVLNAQGVARAAIGLRDSGFVPDVIMGHNSWGEIWYLKDIFPQAKLIGYFEFFYSLPGAEIGFDPEVPITPDSAPRIRTKNLVNLMGLNSVDLGQCPTQWQKSLYPRPYHPILKVVHEGIDTAVAAPDPAARLLIPAAQRELTAGDEVVTYVARNLEPYRGFPSFMRSLPSILDRRPNAQVVIIGGDDVSYGQRLPNKQTYRQKLLDELQGQIDLSRVHFLGTVPYAIFLKALQISRVHVYLTYPFVLSWSMLEAMSAGCLVVGSRTPPVQEVIQHGLNGILADIFSPREIAERVIEGLADNGAFDQIRSNARQTIVDRFDLRTVCLPRQLRMIDEALCMPGEAPAKGHIP